MNERVYNFYPGPATLPLPVLEAAREELLAFQSSGMSVMEISHRSKQYEGLQNETADRLKRLLKIGDNYKVLFLQGGASMQFDMVPMNFLTPEKTADYLVTGSFAQKAAAEGKYFGQVHTAVDTKEENFRRIPDPAELKFSPNPVYVHITSNNTIYGTQWQTFPDCGDVPLVADMSSDILSRPFDAKPFGLIYAGAQKNLGPAGVTIVIIREDLLAKANPNLPVMYRYETFAKNNSLYNTPPTFSIYMVSLVLKWLEDQGGVEAIYKHNQEKAALIYDAIDQSSGFYQGHAEKNSRSLMNVTFRLPSTELEEKFVREATDQGLVGLKGHRSVGGLRASIYNAMSYEGCKALADFMKDFLAKNG
ncbi:MAG TPA: 3-phosphoserine/phosphohydroxythreonine transaminase [Hydrogenispora sp.]|jgi:phosphoserine aminotransferase|nr:3-phosphoserine/phosphohydroxythreonine transaminase [Hydrogenispora sp.]